MASITNPKEQGIWHELKELDFLNWFFSWFFLLLTQLSEPLMLLSTLYVIAETGVHAISSPGIHALAVGIMITAPEILLPGAFVKAAKTRDQGGRFSVLLYVMCWTFVGLTLLTLADLFIWHLSGTPLACLMYARCAAAVGYSILMRVMSHGHGQVLQVAVPDVLAMIATLSEQVQNIPTVPPEQVQLADIEKAIDRRLAQVQYPDIEGLLEHLDRVQNGRMEMIVQRVTEQVTITIEQATAPRLQAVNVRTIEQEQSARQKRLAPPKLERIVPSEPPVGERVQGYIEQQLTTGQAMPTLQQIMDSVGCSKGTAIAQRKRYNEHSADTGQSPVVIP